MSFGSEITSGATQTSEPTLFLLVPLHYSSPRMNGHAKKVVAFSYILCGNLEAASTYLDQYSDSRVLSKSDFLMEEYTSIKRAMKAGVEVAAELLNAWVVENKNKYGIS